MAYSIRKDVIIATGRSDYPNQINNVLVFPYIFRGTLDTRAYSINTQMLLEAANTIANIARKETPEEIKALYNEELTFGKDYFIPKLFDRRLFLEVSSVVAKSAIETGVARKKIPLDEYRKQLVLRLNSM